MFCPIPKELQAELFKKSSIGVSKIKHIPRTQKDFFFARELFNEHSNSILNENNTVDCFDRFQSVADAQNEFRKVLYKPLLALKLASVHQLHSDWELSFAMIDMITCEPVEAILLNSLSEFGLSIFYAAYSVVLFADALLEFTLRCAISLVQESLNFALDGLVSVLGDLGDKKGDNTKDTPIVSAIHVEVVEENTISDMQQAIRV